MSDQTKNGNNLSSNKDSELDLHYQKIDELSQEIKDRLKEKIIFSSPIIERDGVGIVYPNTLNIIQGKTGTHKSRLAELLISCLLSIIPGLQFLGYRKPLISTNLFSVLYVDTERNIKDQLPYALQSLIAKAGLPVGMPSNMDCITLIDAPRELRFQLLERRVRETRKKYSGHLVVVIDVLTDCILNFNDPKESLKLIDMMNRLINKHDITFIGVIHENPGQGEKARGHAGTEAYNKASAQIQVSVEKFDNDDYAVKIKTMKVRNQKPPTPFYARYSEEEKGLVLADDNIVSKLVKERRLKARIEDVAEYLMDNMIGPVKRQRLIADLIEAFDCGEMTIIKRLKELVHTPYGISGMEDDVIYHLVKIKSGKEVFFELQRQLDSQELVKDKDLVTDTPS